jgi:acetyl esterase/lipase
LRIGLRFALTLSSVLLATAIVAVDGGESAAAGVTTVSYGQSRYQTITVYPSPAKGSALIILVHGGGWDSKPTQNYLPTEAADLQSAGFAVFDVNYDTTPRGQGAFPLEINDVVAATIWSVTHAAAYGASPTNVEMVGGSAGGQLIAMAAEEINAFAPDAVRSIVTLSGALDFVKKMQDIQNGTVRGYDAFHAQTALGCRLRLGTCTPQLETKWSPAENVTNTNCPPASLIINSSHESEPVDQADSMTSALRAHNCAVTETIRNGSAHSFAYWKAVSASVIGFLGAN